MYTYVVMIANFRMALWIMSTNVTDVQQNSLLPYYLLSMACSPGRETGEWGVWRVGCDVCFEITKQYTVEPDRGTGDNVTADILTRETTIHHSLPNPS